MVNGSSSNGGGSVTSSSYSSVSQVREYQDHSLIGAYSANLKVGDKITSSIIEIYDVDGELRYLPNPERAGHEPLHLGNKTLTLLTGEDNITGILAESIRVNGKLTIDDYLQFKRDNAPVVQGILGDINKYKK